jgi:hypothetical protein
MTSGWLIRTPAQQTALEESRVAHVNSVLCQVCTEPVHCLNGCHIVSTPGECSRVAERPGAVKGAPGLRGAEDP